MCVCVWYLSCFRGLYALHNLLTRKILPRRWYHFRFISQIKYCVYIQFSATEMIPLRDWLLTLWGPHEVGGMLSSWGRPSQDVLLFSGTKIRIHNKDYNYIENHRDQSYYTFNYCINWFLNFCNYIIIIIIGYCFFLSPETKVGYYISVSKQNNRRCYYIITLCFGS